MRHLDIIIRLHSKVWRNPILRTAIGGKNTCYNHQSPKPGKPGTRDIAQISRGQAGYVLYLALCLLLVIAGYLSIIISAEHLARMPVRREMGRLKAEVAARSGLALAQACVAGYGGNTIAWHTDMVEHRVDGTGLARVRARHEAGWLHVVSTGTWLRDTVTLRGILGTAPPPFCAVALSTLSAAGAFVVADRARVTGDIATPGGRVVIKGSGMHTGRARTFLPVEYTSGIIDSQFREVARVLSEGAPAAQGHELVRYGGPEMFRSAVAAGSAEIWVNGGLVIDDTLDLSGTELWVLGNLAVCGDACVASIRARVRGNTLVSGRACIDGGTVFTTGDMRIVDRARVCVNAVCADTLRVGDDARVDYPSVLYLSGISGSDGRRRGKAVIIEDRARVTGTVMTARVGRAGSSATVMLGGKARVNGLLFTPETVTTYGRVTGSVYAGAVVYRRKRSVYEGWLMETVIAGCDMSAMVLPLVFPGAEPVYLWIEREAGGRPPWSRRVL